MYTILTSIYFSLKLFSFSTKYFDFSIACLAIKAMQPQAQVNLGAHISLVNQSLSQDNQVPSDFLVSTADFIILIIPKNIQLCFLIYSPGTGKNNQDFHSSFYLLSLHYCGPLNILFFAMINSMMRVRLLRNSHSSDGLD